MNRQQRRAAEAIARKHNKRVERVVPDQLIEAQVMQRMYDQRTAEVVQLNSMYTQQQAITAGIMVELDVEQVTISRETLELMTTGALAGFNRELNDDGGVVVTLIFAEGEVDDVAGGEEE